MVAEINEVNYFTPYLYYLNHVDRISNMDYCVFPSSFFCEIARQLRGDKKETNNSKKCILCSWFYINTPFTQYWDFQFLTDCVTVASVYLDGILFS